jgi:hypothetical protein
MIRFLLTAFETAGCILAAWLATKYGVLIGGSVAMMFVVFAYAEGSFGWGRRIGSLERKNK